VTLLVDPDEAERLTLASTEGKIQLALRNPLDKATPVTRGIKPSVLLGLVAATPRAGNRVASGAKPFAPALAQDPTVEIIRGDKRAHEVVRQEQQ
jgi:pilus assembly protein CpaB